MKISIVIPTFNQADYLREAIESIRQQGWDDFEIIIIDGGSTDSTLSVIDEFSKMVSYSVSEPDRGQTHAINKGLSRVTGDIWCFLNSDDIFLPNAFRTVVDHFCKSDVFWVSGVGKVFGNVSGVEIDRLIVPVSDASAREMISPWRRDHQYVFPFSGACFMSRRLLEDVGFFDESFHFSMDIEYYCRSAIEHKYRQVVVKDVLAGWRWHEHSKTFLKGLAYGFREDEVRIAEKFLSFLPKEDAAEVLQEIRVEKMALAARRSIFHLQSGSKYSAFRELYRSARSDPKCMIFRPWLGALRRVAFSRS